MTKGSGKSARGRRRSPAASGAPLVHPSRSDLTAQASEKDLHERLAARLRSARAQRFMTRKALAEQSGVSLAYLARVEAGTGNISLSLLQRLALALHVPIESFVAADESNGPELSMIIEFLKRQTTERLAQIREQLLDGDREAQRIALVGIRGVGKSTLGPLLAERLKIPFVELNSEIEKEAKLAIGEIFTVYGQHGYRVLERRCLERIIADYPNVVLATGGGVVAEPATYELLLASFFTVWLKAKPRVMFERVLLQHDARIASAELRDEALENIARTLEAREPHYELAHASFDTSGKPLAQIVSALLTLLPARQRAAAARSVRL